MMTNESALRIALSMQADQALRIRDVPGRLDARRNPSRDFASIACLRSKIHKEIYKDKSSYSRRRLLHNRCNRQSVPGLLAVSQTLYYYRHSRVFTSGRSNLSNGKREHASRACVSAGDAFAKQTCMHVLYVQSLCTFEKSSSEHSNSNLSRISRIRDRDRALIGRTISGRSRSEIILSNFADRLIASLSENNR